MFWLLAVDGSERWQVGADTIMFRRGNRRTLGSSTLTTAEGYWVEPQAGGLYEVKDPFGEWSKLAKRET